MNLADALRRLAPTAGITALGTAGLPAAYVPMPLRGGEQRLNAGSAVAVDGALLVDDAGPTRPGSRPP
jgi:hypothetical protein